MCHSPWPPERIRSSGRGPGTAAQRPRQPGLTFGACGFSTAERCRPRWPASRLARCDAGLGVTQFPLLQSAGSWRMIGSSLGCSTAQPLPLHGRLRRICGCIRMSASKKPRPEKDEELIASATKFLRAHAASAKTSDAKDIGRSGRSFSPLGPGGIVELTDEVLQAGSDFVHRAAKLLKSKAAHEKAITSIAFDHALKFLAENCPSRMPWARWLTPSLSREMLHSSISRQTTL